jgi:hypothetical protein
MPRTYHRHDLPKQLWHEITASTTQSIRLARPSGSLFRPRVVSPKLTCAKIARPQAGKPRGVTWNGAGGWVLVSQSRQENFSRTVWITYQCRGIISTVAMISSRNFDNFDEPEQRRSHGA